MVGPFVCVINNAALRAHCRILKNGHIRHPGVDMLTYPLTVVSHDGWLTYPWTAVTLQRPYTFGRFSDKNILYQLSDFLMSRHDIKLKDFGKSLRGLIRFKIL